MGAFPVDGPRHAETAFVAAAAINPDEMFWP
jgi:hypothetical protein